MKNLDEKTRRLILIFAIIIVFILLLFLIFFIIGKLRNGSLSYDEIEEKMLVSAKKYYSDNNTLLPEADNDSSEVDANVLSSGGYMKDLNSYVKKKNVKCSGKVIVTKSGDKYNYVPVLDCGKSYKTNSLYDMLINSVVDSGDGLYQFNQYYDGGEGVAYVYRGEYPKNYISINKTLWRIVKINTDGTINIVQSNDDPKKNDYYYWDNKYNIKTNTYEGINDFNVSRIKRKLELYYENDTFIPTEYKSILLPRKVCIGGRSIKDTVNNGKIECSKISDVKMFYSILQTNDFINASLDKNCKRIEDASCSNFNYLTKFGKTWWFITVNSKSYNKGYAADGIAYRRILSYQASIRVSTNLNKNVVYSSGTGTKADPYIIKK